MARSPTQAAPGRARVERAPRGGGTHGAFAGNAIDRPLRGRRLGIAGASAGAMNAAEGLRRDRMRMHGVRDDPMAGLGHSGGRDAEWAFLAVLRDAGRKVAETFLPGHGAAIGPRSTLHVDHLRERV